MINFSLQKFRSSDATETFRVKNSDNVLSKSRKLETKSSWIIKLRSFFKFEKAKEPRLADFNFSLLFIYRSSCTCVLQLLHVFTACQSYETHDRSGAPNYRGPRFLEPAEPAIATNWNWVSVPGVFVELARDFSSLKGVRNPCDRIESILDVNTARSAPRKPHAACSQKVEGSCLRIREGTLDVQSLLTTTYHHATMNAFLRGLLPVLRRSTVRVSSSTVRHCSSAASRVCDRCRQ